MGGLVLGGSGPAVGEWEGPEYRFSLHHIPIGMVQCTVFTSYGYFLVMVTV